MTRLTFLAATLPLLTACIAPAEATRPVTANGTGDAAWVGAIRFTFRTGGPIRSAPAVGAGVVYLGSGDGKLYAIDAKTGAERWRFATGGPVMSSPALAAGRVFASSRDGFLYALAAADGALVWRHRFGAELGMQNYWDYALSSPTLRGDVLYIGGGDGHLYAFDAASGRVRWSFDAGARIRSTPAVAAGLVVVGTMDGRVVAVDSASGVLRWSFATDGAAHAFADKRNDTTSVFASPTIAGERVMVGSRDGNLYALELATGKLAWRSTHDGGSWILSTAFDGRTLYVGSGSALIVQAVDPATGLERWRAKTRGAVFSGIAIAGETLLFSDFSGALSAIDRRSGVLRWRFPLGGRALATPVVADGVVYAASDDGVLFALQTAPAPLPVETQPRRLVYEEGKKSAGAFSWFRSGIAAAVVGQLKAAGYEQPTSAALVELMSTGAASGERSVVVFADNKIPAELVDTRGGPAPIRRYLERGGKVVLLGPNPVIYKTDAVTGELLDIDTTAPLAVFGIRYPAPNVANGFYASQPTAAGRAMGLRSFSIGYQPIELQQGERFTALALDEFGMASAWLMGYGGPPGTGLLQLSLPRQDVADLAEIQAAIEYGVGW